MSTNVWLYGDHRVMRVGIGSDTGRSDCRYYHVLTLNLLAGKPCWRKLPGSGNYDYKHTQDAEKEMRGKLHGDIYELTEAEADALFMDRRSNMFTPRPEGAKIWDTIMKAKEEPMKKRNDRCPLQSECERTCNAAGHERDCDYYRANCLPGMDIPGQEVNTDGEPPYLTDEDEDVPETHTSACPYFVGITEPDEEGKRHLLCKTREQPYSGALYDCGCSPDADPGYDGCRLYWLQRIKEDIGEAPQDIRDGSTKAMRAYYEQTVAKRNQEANNNLFPGRCPHLNDKGGCDNDGGKAPSAGQLRFCNSSLAYACTHYDAAASNEPPEVVDESGEADAISAGPAVATPQEAAPPFDYSGLDGQTVATLHSAEEMIRSARKDYIVKVADAVGMAHDELVANCDGHNQHSEDTFIAWCRSVNLGKDTAYRLLQVSNLFSASSPIEQNVLKQASPSLLYAAAKPSAPAELVQGVKDGDITTHKQYQTLLKELEAAEKAKRDAEYRVQTLEASYRTARSNEQEAILQKQEARKERDGARQALEAERAEYIARIHELESRPIDVAVAEPDPAEVERLARERAEAMTAALRGRLKTAENNIKQMHAQRESLEGQLEDWREAARRQTPLTFENVRPMARDLASSVTALYSTFQLAACELRGSEYEQCAAPLIEALETALTGLRGAVNERGANTYKEDEDFE